MSKINAVRIINLNYNNNAIRVVDETFHLKGETTLLSLRNGGGKSVMVQMMTAPFVHKQYRKTVDRPFESFFTSSKPTFILVEWKLDGGAGYCLVGMMVRKSQGVEEQSSEPLEIINFISEYKERCTHDIYHIPLVEKVKNEVILKNFNTCKQMMEEYKRDSSKKFYYYDMNHYAQSRQYFDKLSEYKIYYKEWENIIRKVNLKESGLSDLFVNCKNEKDLIDKWFIEAVESKLNKEQNRMKEFGSIIEKYIRMYKDNQSKIERRDTILKFKEDMKEIEEKALVYQEISSQTREQENYIAAFIEKLCSIEDKVKGKLADSGEKVRECEDRISYVLYEKFSINIYQLEQELKDYIGHRDLYQLEISSLEKEHENIVRKLNLQYCAKQQMTVTQLDGECQSLEQRLIILRKDNQDLEPRRVMISTWLNHYYEGQIIAEKENCLSLEGKRDEKDRQIKEQVKKEERCVDDLKEISIRKTELKTEAKIFSQKEDEFNEKYKEDFTRDIWGYYIPGFLDIKEKEYDLELKEASQEEKKLFSEKLSKQQKRKSLTRNSLDCSEKIHQLSLQGKLLENIRDDFISQKEEREIILRYLEKEEDLLWKKDRIIESLNKKCREIEISKTQLEKEEQELQKEYKRLTSGEILEVPEEISDLMMRLELHPIYGMKWLEKNGYGREHNLKLVRQQPFLPYSLILPRAEIEKLKYPGNEIYTSYPIPLLCREELEEHMSEGTGALLNLGGVSFYLWFNEELLDEEALKVMIDEISSKIRKKKEQIENRKKEYEEYTEKTAIIKKQSLTKQEWDKNISQIEENESSLLQSKQLQERLKHEMEQLEKDMEALEKALDKNGDLIRHMQNRERDFGKFLTDYEHYKMCKENVQKYEVEEKKREEEKELASRNRQKYQEEYKSLLNEISSSYKKQEELEEKLLIYSRKDSTLGEQADKSIPELEAEYKAITEQFSGEQKYLEEQLQSYKAKRNNSRKELEKKALKYGFSQEEWKTVTYNEEEEEDLEKRLETKEEEIEIKNNRFHEADKKVSVTDSKLSEKIKQLKEELGKEEPLEKEKIHTTDFEAEINKLKHSKRELLKIEKQLETRAGIISGNLTALQEYQDFLITKPIVWQEDFEAMDEKSLREYSGSLKRDYRNICDEKDKQRRNLDRHLQRLYQREEYVQDYYRKPLEAMMEVTGEAGLILSQLYTTVSAYDSQIEKLAVDINMVEEEKEKIEGLLEDYLKEVHSNMAKIDNHSTINIREKAIKMLRISLPDWEENEGLYRQRLKDYMTELTKGGIRLYGQNENIVDFLSGRVTTKILYDSVVGIGNIEIKLYKIEEQREYPITWAQVARNSGGEGFLSAFVILSSLLYYMRRDDTDIFADKNEGKVLVMDNPFAQTNAVHLLKPLMDMAKKTNTQLICLSGLGGDSIYSRFDNIYVLNLISTALRGGTQYLKGEHTRGRDEEVMIPSRIEVVEQLTLF